jgi:hypothetical protein
MAIVVVACICVAILLLETIIIAIFGKLPSGKKKEPAPVTAPEPAASGEIDPEVSEV